MAAIISRGPDTRRHGTGTGARVARAAAAVLAAVAAAAPVAVAVPAAVAVVLLVARPGRRAEVTVDDLAELEAIVLDVRADLAAETHAGIDRIDRVASIVADIRDQIR